MKMYVIQINNGFVINLDVNAKNWIIGALAKDEYMWNPSVYELFEQAKKFQNLIILIFLIFYIFILFPEKEINSFHIPLTWPPQKDSDIF